MPTFRNLIDTARMAYPRYRQAIVHITAMPLATRSLMIKLCQAQCVPLDHTSALYLMCASLPPYTLDIAHGGLVQSPLTTFRNLSTQIQSPVESAFIIDLCRSLPITHAEMEDARQKGWMKEALLIESPERPCQINWDPIFDPRMHHIPMMSFMSPNPAMAQFIYQGLLRWRTKIQNRKSPLLPRMTRKNMSRTTRREFEELSGVSLDHTTIFSQEDAQRYYHETGTKLEGATEMRQKWYASGIKPRTYFAQGGTHYFASTHLQDIFSELTDCIPTTHKVSRLQPTRLHVSQDEHCLIYDLTSFSSNCSEQRGFVRRLAEFCYGVEVELFDMRHGIIVCDLGDLLSDYYTICVHHPEVSYERMPGIELDLERTYITDHGVASMLGIFGNLGTCTFAHGALMMQLVPNEDQVNVAGDDGIIVERSENYHEIDWAIQTIGAYERSKTFRTNEEGAICLKRPIRHDIGGLSQGFLCVPPSLTTLAYYIFGYADSRYSFHSDDMCGTDAGRSVVGMDLIRFLRSVHRASWKLSDSDIDSALSLAIDWTKLVFGGDGWTKGNHYASGGTYIWPCTNISTDDLRSNDITYLLLAQHYQGHVTVSRRGYEEPEPLTSDLDIGDVFECNSSWWLRYATILGYLEKERIETTLYDLEGFDYLMRSFSEPEPEVYRYIVNSPIHSIFLSL